MTAEGLIDVTFNKCRWAHIDNDADEAFDLGVGTEIGTLKQVDQELSVEELNHSCASQSGSRQTGCQFGVNSGCSLFRISLSLVRRSGILSFRIALSKLTSSSSTSTSTGTTVS